MSLRLGIAGLVCMMLQAVLFGIGAVLVLATPLKEDAMQCGYCTCGMIMMAYALLQRNRNPSESQIMREMNGNICRCGTYQRIVAAVKDAAKQMQGGGR